MCLLFRGDNDLFRGSERHLQSPWRKTHIYQLAVSGRGKDEARVGCVRSRASSSLDRELYDEMFVSGGASRGYCSAISPPTDGLPPLYTALISPRLTSRHARELPADSSLRLEVP